jgi:phosphate transport system substrate-binding protein
MRKGGEMSIKPSRKLVFLIPVALLILGMLLMGCGKSLSGTVTEAGSTTVYPLAQALGDAFHEKRPDVAIETAQGGSGAGISQCASGAVDIGAASRELKPTDPQLVTHLLAWDGIAIITKPSNPVTGLTKDQVKEIFNGTITNWKDVGGPDHAINVYVREETSGTRGAFQELVMGTDSIVSTAIVQSGSGPIKVAVGGDAYGIGFESMAYLESTIKALDIDGVAATQANAKSGTYPIIRPLYFLTKEEPTGLVKDFIDFCLSAEGQQIVADNGYITVS